MARLRIEEDEMCDRITIEGVTYTGEFFRTWAIQPREEVTVKLYRDDEGVVQCDLISRAWRIPKESDPSWAKWRKVLEDPAQRADIKAQFEADRSALARGEVPEGMERVEVEFPEGMHRLELPEKDPE